jgi:hypothetical protein
MVAMVVAATVVATATGGDQLRTCVGRVTGKRLRYPQATPPP